MSDTAPEQLPFFTFDVGAEQTTLSALGDLDTDGQIEVLGQRDQQLQDFLSLLAQRIRFAVVPVAEPSFPPSQPGAAGVVAQWLDVGADALTFVVLYPDGSIKSGTVTLT